MSRATEKNDAIKEQRINDIMQVALRLFALDGYDTVTIDQIVKTCGCSHGLFYHYFSSKKELFDAILLESQSRKRFYPKEWLLLDSPVEAIWQFVQKIIHLLKHDEDHCYYMYLYLNLSYQKSLPRPTPRKNKFFPQLLEEVIQKGQSEGTFIQENSHQMMLTFLALLRGMFYDRLQSRVETYLCPSPYLILRLLLKESVLNQYMEEKNYVEKN